MVQAGDITRKTPEVGGHLCERKLQKVAEMKPGKPSRTG